MILAAGAILGIRLLLALTKTVPVGVDQAEAFMGMGLGAKELALIGWLELVVIVFLGYKWLKSGWAAVVLAANPWLQGLTLFNVREGLMVIGLGLILVGRKKLLVSVLGLGLVIVSVWWGKPYWIKLGQENLAKQLNADKLAFEVNEIQKINFLATGKTYILPAVVRKIIYNKPVLAGQKTLTKLVSLIDFEQWTNPLGAWVLTGMSGLPPKGVVALFYFWEVALVVWFLANKPKTSKALIVLLIAVVAPALFFEKKFFFVSGVGLLLLIVGGVVRGMDRINSTLIKRGLLLLYLIGVGHLYYHLFYKQDNYRYSDANLYYQAAAFIRGHPEEAKFVVTTRFGPMEKMLRFYEVDMGKVEVRDFDWKTETESGEIVYIGLPKEMEGSENQLMLKVEADDELVYKYGKGLWIAKK